MRYAGPAVISSLLAACTPVLHSPDGPTGGDWVAPENSWPTGDPPPADLEGEGYSEGQVIHDIRLRDQFGDEVSLWQFYGMVVALDISTMWCGPCAGLADEVDSVWEDYRDEGFIYVTILPENNVAEPPSQEDLQAWADEHSISAPILGDDAGYCAQIVPEQAYPQVLVVGREMVIETGRVSPVDDASIRAAIERSL